MAGALRPALLLSLFPKAEVDVFLLVLDAHGGESAACVVAASCALARAGVPLRDLVWAATVARSPRPPHDLVADPTAFEVDACDGCAVFVAALSACEEVVAVAAAGPWPPGHDATAEAVELAIDVVKGVDEPLRAALRTAAAVDVRERATAEAALQLAHPPA